MSQGSSKSACIFGSLRCSLSQVWKHGMARIAKEDSFAARMNPAIEWMEIAHFPFEKLELSAY